MNVPFRRLSAALALTLLLLPAARAQHKETQPADADKPWPRIGFVEAFDGRSIPTLGRTRGEAGDVVIDIRNANDGSNRLFLITRRGVIYIFKDGKLLPEPFLDVTTKTTMEGERGLLSMTFPPGNKAKTHFYIYYTDLSHDVHVSRYTVDPTNPNRALPDSEETLLVVNHREQVNHNGGQLQFGADGMLYFAIGDGGSGFDPHLNGQNLGVYLGKMMRIDVEGKPDEGKPYHVPADNPFVKNPDAKPEIWALGLNPFRFSFDPKTGDMYIGNVGQNLWEQIYFSPGTSKGGENYGWSMYEGTHNDSPGLPPPQKSGTVYGITWPVAEFSHKIKPLFTSITGGYVYRGKEFPGMNGFYFFSDWGNGGNVGQIWALRQDAGGKWESHQVDDDKSPVLKAVTFGVDEQGSMYISSFGDGKIFKLVDLNEPAPAAPPSTSKPGAPADTSKPAAPADTSKPAAK